MIKELQLVEEAKVRKMAKEQDKLSS